MQYCVNKNSRQDDAEVDVVAIANAMLLLLLLALVRASFKKFSLGDIIWLWHEITQAWLIEKQ